MATNTLKSDFLDRVGNKLLADINQEKIQADKMAQQNISRLFAVCSSLKSAILIRLKQGYNIELESNKNNCN